MITVQSSKSSGKTEKFLESLQQSGNFLNVLGRFGQMGVHALSRATPVETGETAASWGYRVGTARGLYFIEWYNTHSEGGAPVAILIQYGHGTGTGGYVAGIDYINPAMRPIFDRITAEVWKQVTHG